jgi:stage III sporulation protein SpoIIIAA
VAKTSDKSDSGNGDGHVAAKVSGGQNIGEQAEVAGGACAPGSEHRCRCQRADDCSKSEVVRMFLKHRSANILIIIKLYV